MSCLRDAGQGLLGSRGLELGVPGEEAGEVRVLRISGRGVFLGAVRAGEGGVVSVAC